MVDSKYVFIILISKYLYVNFQRLNYLSGDYLLLIKNELRKHLSITVNVTRFFNIVYIFNLKVNVMFPYGGAVTHRRDS